MSVHEISRQNSFSLSLSIMEVSCKGSEETVCRAKLPYFFSVANLIPVCCLTVVLSCFYDYVWVHFTNALEIKDYCYANVQHFCLYCFLLKVMSIFSCCSYNNNTFYSSTFPYPSLICRETYKQAIHRLISPEK